MAAPPNPNPSRISSAMWRLWNDFDAYYPPALLGGIYAAKPGYHNYRNALPTTDYSVRLMADKRGSGTKSDGIDLSMPPDGMKLHTMRLDKAARARDPRLYTPSGPVLREFIGTKDGKTVYCYVLTGGQALGVGADAGPDPGRDESHLWHIHLSIIREFCEDWSALSGVLSVLMGQSLAEWQEETAMLTPLEKVQLRDTHYTTAVAIVDPMDPTKKVPLHAYLSWLTSAVKELAASSGADLNAIQAQLDEIETDVEMTPSQVIAQLTAVGNDEGSTALIAALGMAEARAFAQAVLAKTGE